MPITFVRSSDAVQRWGKSIEGRWSALTPTLDVFVIPVRHSAMFHQNEVEKVAALLRPLLDAGQEKTLSTAASPSTSSS